MHHLCAVSVPTCIFRINQSKTDAKLCLPHIYQSRQCIETILCLTWCDCSSIARTCLHSAAAQSAPELPEANSILTRVERRMNIVTYSPKGNAIKSQANKHTNWTPEPCKIVPAISISSASVACCTIPRHCCAYCCKKNTTWPR